MVCTPKACLALNPGELRHKIIIQTPTESSDSYGGFTATWATFATVWAALNPVRNREYPISLQNETRTLHKITIRYVAGLTDKMRVNFGGRIFNITSIINREERNIVLDIIAEEGMAT